jgi:hypothetical protein
MLSSSKNGRHPAVTFVRRPSGPTSGLRSDRGETTVSVPVVDFWHFQTFSSQGLLRIFEFRRKHLKDLVDIDGHDEVLSCRKDLSFLVAGRLDSDNGILIDENAAAAHPFEF